MTPSATILTTDERRALRRRCTLVVPGFAAPTPAEEFRRMGDWCAANGVEHDVYGAGALVEGFERRIAERLGLPAAVFLPSGVMAQLAAARIWAEARGAPRIGLHPTSHLLLHESQAHAELMRLDAVPLGDRWRPLLARNLEACAQPLACVMVELPIREAGGQLPTWDELVALKAAAADRGVALHLDGARLWECGPWYGRPYAEIAAGFDSVYVSVYKGIGGLAGAVLCASEDVAAQARVWRRRMGGTLYHLSPLVIAAAMRFDERLALMPALYRRTCDLAAGLATLPGLRVNPAVPQATMLHLYFPAAPDAVMAARDALAQSDGAWLVDTVRPADLPGWSTTEITVGDQLLAADDARVTALFAALLASLRAR